MCAHVCVSVCELNPMKVLAMFRTTVEGGLSDEEVVARREVYGDNRPTEVRTQS